MWLSGNGTPDFRTINRFRGEGLKEEINNLFSEIVLLLQEAGYVSLDVQYIDGTKIESASNRYTFVWHGSVEKYKSKLEDKIRSVFSLADEHIEQEKQEEDVKESPKQIDRGLLREKLKELNSRLSGWIKQNVNKSSGYRKITCFVQRNMKASWKNLESVNFTARPARMSPSCA